MSNRHTKTLDVNASAPLVWPVISDIANLPAVLSGMMSLETEGPDTGRQWVRPGPRPG
jgi:carbon monoxide dehydrogenase subunit G